MSKMESSDDDRMREDVLSEGSRNSAKSSSSSENEEDTIEQRVKHFVFACKILV